MKKTILFITVSFFTLTACQMSTNDVKEIHTLIRSSLTKCNSSEKEFLESIKTVDSVKVFTKLNELMVICTEEKNKLNSQIQIEPDKDLLVNALKRTGLTVIETYISIKEKYTEYAIIACLPDSLYKTHFNEGVKIGKEIDEELKSVISRFKTVEKSVEEKYGYVLPQ